MHMILSRDDLKRILGEYVSNRHNVDLEGINFLANDQTVLVLKSKPVDSSKVPFVAPTPTFEPRNLLEKDIIT